MNLRDSWQIEKNGGSIQVKIFDIDGTPFIDREVKTLSEACQLIEGTKEQIAKVLEASSNQEQE